MYALLPEGYLKVKDILNKAEFFGGFEYSIQEVSLVKDSSGNHFLRIYENICVSEDNGRPCTTERDSIIPVSKSKVVNKSNWMKYERMCEEKIILKDLSGVYVDEKVLDWVKCEGTKHMS